MVALDLAIPHIELTTRREEGGNTKMIKTEVLIAIHVLIQRNLGTESYTLLGRARTLMTSLHKEPRSFFLKSYFDLVEDI